MSNDLGLTVSAVIKNLGFEGIARIADGSILDILNEVESSINQSKIQEIIVEIYGEAELLLDPTKRKIIFEYLTKEQASKVCEGLGIRFSEDDPWSKIININLTSDRKHKILEIFGVSSA